MTPRQAMGGILAAILLGIFVYLLIDGFIVMYKVTSCEGAADCIKAAQALFNQPMESSLNTIGGLVSAIVIAELAITKPTEVPAARLFAAPAPAPVAGGPAAAAPDPGKAVKFAVLAYLTVWVCSGVAAFVWGSLLHPDALQALTDYGNAWFGLAVASGYAYFGVNRN